MNEFAIVSASGWVAAAAEAGERVHNDLPMPALAMGVGAFVGLVVLLWITTRFDPDR